jgi:hypothetical protein
MVDITKEIFSTIKSMEKVKCTLSMAQGTLETGRMANKMGKGKYMKEQSLNVLESGRMVKK